VLTAVFVTLLGVTLYVLFRGRNRLTALAGLAGFLLMSALFTVSAAANLRVHELAQDLDRGEVIANEESVIEIGRSLTALGDISFFLGVTFFAIGLVGYGLNIVMAPEPAPGDLVDAAAPMPVVSPMTWMGWLAIVSGLCYLVGWLWIAIEAFFLLILVGFLLTLIWYLAFGLWLVVMGRLATET
jgi:hypothetical protein